ncbi:MAG: OsmC family protein [Anaerolineales bacterium]|nr:OsmC family protein [Anaerolineales bacterium]
MAVRKATARWEGTLKEGVGTLKGKAIELGYSFTSRFEEGAGTNPEELIGAAHAGCYTMALNVALERAGFLPKHVESTANVYIEKGDAGFSITRIHLQVEADVPNIDEAAFQQHVEATKTGCIVSRALAAVEITVDAKLLTGASPA